MVLSCWDLEIQVRGPKAREHDVLKPTAIQEGRFLTLTYGDVRLGTQDTKSSVG